MDLKLPYQSAYFMMKRLLVTHLLLKEVALLTLNVLHLYPLSSRKSAPSDVAGAGHF